MGSHDFGGGIDIRRHVVVQLFVGPGKAPGLLQIVGHTPSDQRTERGTKSVASLRGSVSEGLCFRPSPTVTKDDRKSLR